MQAINQSSNQNRVIKTLAAVAGITGIAGFLTVPLAGYLISHPEVLSEVSLSSPAIAQTSSSSGGIGSSSSGGVGTATQGTATQGLGTGTQNTTGTQGLGTGTQSTLGTQGTQQNPIQARFGTQIPGQELPNNAINNLRQPPSQAISGAQQIPQTSGQVPAGGSLPSRSTIGTISNQTVGQSGASIPQQREVVSPGITTNYTTNQTGGGQQVPQVQTSAPTTGAQQVPQYAQNNQQAQPGQPVPQQTYGNETPQSAGTIEPQSGYNQAVRGLW